jgi:hypothetical protein
MTPHRLLLILALIVGISGCERFQRERATPSELIGIWATDDDPRYVGRTFEFRDSSVIFKTGDGFMDFTIHPIRDVTSTHMGNSVDYVIEYAVAESGDYIFSFTYFPLDGGSIRFTNQPEMTWTRVPPESARN